MASAEFDDADYPVGFRRSGGLLCVHRSARANQPTNTSPADWKAVDDAMGRTGAIQPGDVYKFSLPRGDMHVTVNGVESKPALALGGWVAFEMMGNEAMVMGDLVLSEDEITPVLTKLQQGGIEQSAVHNHVLHESPRVMYMHIGGHGDPAKLGRAIHDALALTKLPAPNPSAPPSQDIGIDTKQIEQVLGRAARSMAVYFNSALPEARRLPKMEWKCRQRWGRLLPSIFSRQVGAKQQLPAIS